MIIQVYSDGSSNGKTGGVGGWAFVVVVDGVKVHEASGSEQKATNNTCELLAAIEGLEYTAATYPQCEDVTIISDSQLVLRFATGEYNVKKMHLLPYVLRLRKVFRSLNAKARWEKGHAGEPNNERCDELAKAARNGNGSSKEKDRVDQILP
jgi:ribonuclease HI